jgi:hypothetical protein
MKRTQEAEKKRTEQRHERFERDAQKRVKNAAAEDIAIDAMVKRSIKLHGP